MRLLSVWAMEFIKLLGGRRLHPVVTQCPICKQMVRLHVNKAGRRHVFRHARTLYEGSRLRVHYTAEMKCVGSGALKIGEGAMPKRLVQQLQSVAHSPRMCMRA